MHYYAYSRHPLWIIKIGLCLQFVFVSLQFYITQFTKYVNMEELRVLPFSFLGWPLSIQAVWSWLSYVKSPSASSLVASLLPVSTSDPRQGTP